MSNARWTVGALRYSNQMEAMVAPSYRRPRQKSKPRILWCIHYKTETGPTNQGGILGAAAWWC